MTDFFTQVDQSEKNNFNTRCFRQLARQIKAERIKRQKIINLERGQQHPADQTIGLATYNIRGLATRVNELGKHLQRLKELRERGARDVIFLQETHLQAEEHQAAAAQYAAMWGYKHTAAHSMSFWSSGAQRRAGVAILVNPYGVFKNMQPWKPERWSEHLIMTTGEVGDQTFLFMNIYAPSVGAARIKYFQELQSLDEANGMTIVCGGDFNCVTNSGIDRYGSSSRADMGAAELTHFLESNGLMDAGAQTIPARISKREKREYAARFHTYRHTKADGQVSSSRIDRFYISTERRNLIRGVEVEEAPCHTDHRGVLLELHRPDGPVRLRKRPRIYPPPHFAFTATQSLVHERLLQLKSAVEDRGPDTVIDQWGDFKMAITKEMTGLKRAARRRMTNSYRARIKRLKKKLQRTDYLAEGQAAIERNGVIAELRMVQQRRSELRARVLINHNAWSSKTSTKHFFRRICTKFGDNVIPTLRSKVPGSKWGPHDKAEIISETWESIFNGMAPQRDGVESYLEKLRTRWATPAMDDIDDDFTEEEVLAAIKRCKRGKACGPDDLNNDWYQDNSELLTPILTKLFNYCLATGFTPPSFDDAFIFSISKGGDTTDPLNYRPIALLNTDYKIFTRVLAWRVRKYIDQVVHSTQFGFVPGRTIHEAIDLFEAAKAACKHQRTLNNAQVLMLDFAKAYDSLDRTFLIKVLRAKGFPPKFIAIVEATHRNTQVQFMANGQLSKPAPVTSGIRQGCPLAPLLFIIAVDVLYDELENDPSLRGIELEAAGNRINLVVAGYADDTAIYLRHKRMQRDAIQAVERFSRMSGLRLNISKSAAISLGGCTHSGQEAEEEQEEELGSDLGLPIEETDSTRYLGHIAGREDTTHEAWRKAFLALTARLALAVGKTNTVQQRAAIASAIIVPKLLYVARHAWPSPSLTKEADLRIRNFVWRSSFALPDRTPSGWIAASLAEQDPKNGGLGMPNIRAELAAMGAMVATQWSLSERLAQQITGAILQERTAQRVQDLTPIRHQPGPRLATDLWRTGMAWAKYGLAQLQYPPQETEEDVARMDYGGAVVQSTGHREDPPQQDQSTAPEEGGGQFLTSGLLNTPVTEINLVDVRGNKRRWADFRKIMPTTAAKVISDILTLHWTATGEVTFEPIGFVIPMPSGTAHEFRELCLAIITTWPEVAFAPEDKTILRVHHKLSDPHHVFTIQAACRTIEHSWGTTHCEVVRATVHESSQRAVARKLEVPEASVWLTPTPELQRCRPLWAGHRRWTQTQRQYRRAYLRQRADVAKAAVRHTQQQWRAQHPEIAEALTMVPWQRLQKLQGVQAYQQQNFVRAKHNRLRLWRTDGARSGCAACGAGGPASTVHLIWECPAAECFWSEIIKMWSGQMATDGERQQARKQALKDFFSLKLHVLPEWVTELLHEQDAADWERGQTLVQDLWALGCVATLSAIWIWNVTLVHPDGRRQPTQWEAATWLARELDEMVNRYAASLYPLTQATKSQLDLIELMGRKFRENRSERSVHQESGSVERIGFFDGGSRGNPGPGGSGSVVVTQEPGEAGVDVIWAAATALGHRVTTNNVAEFVGLHRVLGMAVEKRWSGIHIVGDSAMIIKMMRERKSPKHHKMQHWYRICRRLADQCRVATWTHLLRDGNKTADWLANLAMDTKTSQMVTLAEVEETHPVRHGVAERIGADVSKWRERREEGATR